MEDDKRSILKHNIRMMCRLLSNSPKIVKKRKVQTAEEHASKQEQKSKISSQQQAPPSEEKLEPHVDKHQKPAPESDKSSIQRSTNFGAPSSEPKGLVSRLLIKSIPLAGYHDIGTLTILPTPLETDKNARTASRDS